MLLMLCSTAILIGRLNPTTEALQTLGLDFCDGAPCFRGIKAGSAWSMVQKRFPDATLIGDGVSLVVQSDAAFDAIGFHPSSDGTLVSTIQLDYPRIPITAATILRYYGVPCHMVVDLGFTSPVGLELIYPEMTVSVPATIYGDPYNPTDSHIQPSSPSSGFWITNDQKYYYGNCAYPSDYTSGTWHGFASLYIYLSRFGRDSGQR